MKARFVVWTVAVCFQFVVASSQEQCDIFGALVKKPGRQCICDQRGRVRCKPRLGGRFLICVLDLSQMGSDIADLIDHIREKKRTFRDFGDEGACCRKGAGCCKSNKNKTIDENFDPPQFTMTERPSIGGGIGEDKVDLGKPMESDIFGDYDDSKDSADTVDDAATDDNTERKLPHRPKMPVSETATKNHPIQRNMPSPKLRSTFPLKKHSGPRSRDEEQRHLKPKIKTEHTSHNDASKNKIKLIKTTLKFKNSRSVSKIKAGTQRKISKVEPKNRKHRNKPFRRTQRK